MLTRLASCMTMTSYQLLSSSSHKAQADSTPPLSSPKVWLTTPLTEMTSISWL